jgi:hypothetical protein
MDDDDDTPDVGQKLRNYIDTHIDEPDISENVLAELIYVANERHLFDDTELSMESVMLAWELVELAHRHAKSGPSGREEIEEFRM